MSKHHRESRERHTSVNPQVQAASQVQGAIPIPSGYSFDSETDLAVWQQYTSLRLASDWRDADLIMVAKCVVYERDIRLATEIIDREGIITEKFNRDGEVIGYDEHPAAKARNNLVAKLVSMHRGLSINQFSSDPRTLNEAGQKAANVIKNAKNADTSLIATLQ